MEIDPRAMPDPQRAEEETSKNQVEPLLKEAQQPDNSQELEALKIKNLELQKQKEHWREKYERDINKPAPPVDFDEESYSDEGKALRSEIQAVKEKLSFYEKNQEEQDVYSKFPELKDKRDEFKEFLADPDNSGIKLEKAAKLFMVEKDLIGGQPKRLGLEKPTGGAKASSPSGISNEDVKRLRETQPRKYAQMIASGKLNLDEIV